MARDTRVGYEGGATDKTHRRPGKPMNRTIGRGTCLRRLAEAAALCEALRDVHGLRRVPVIALEGGAGSVGAGGRLDEQVSEVLADNGG